MSNTKIDDAKAKLLEINSVIKQLDESMRGPALQILVPLYFPNTEKWQSTSLKPAATDKRPGGNESIHTEDLGQFISAFEIKTPTENVMLLVAWLYSQYGAYPISAKEIKELADSAGLIVPTRPDNTMRTAKNDGKSLFQQQGKGWRLTVSGELYMKSEFSVIKGNKPLPKD